MGLTREQADKIEVTETTEVAYINGEKIYAENLQKWAYRRLETWPDLLSACRCAVADLEGATELLDGDIPECWNKSIDECRKVIERVEK